MRGRASAASLHKRSDQMLRVITALGGRPDVNQGVLMIFDPLLDLLLVFADCPRGVGPLELRSSLSAVVDMNMGCAFSVLRNAHRPRGLPAPGITSGGNSDQRGSRLWITMAILLAPQIRRLENLINDRDN
jgi:hypothetical protein